MADLDLPQYALGTNIRLLACVYCGEVADTRDHVIPRIWSRRNTRCGSGRLSAARKGEWTVPACRECNSLLNANLIFTVPERAAYLLERYKRKWRKIIRRSTWTAPEIDETTGRFHQSVESIAAEKALIERRMLRLESVASMGEDFLRP